VTTEIDCGISRIGVSVLVAVPAVRAIGARTSIESRSVALAPCWANAGMAAPASIATASAWRIETGNGRTAERWERIGSLEVEAGPGRERAMRVARWPANKNRSRL
jgi:hypothetical protein